MTTNVSAELNNQQSPLYQWLYGRMSNGGFKIINNHNYFMANNYHQLIKPPSWDIDFPLIGTAINYAVYYYLCGVSVSNRALV